MYLTGHIFDCWNDGRLQMCRPGLMREDYECVALRAGSQQWKLNFYLMLHQGSGIFALLWWLTVCMCFNSGNQSACFWWVIASRNLIFPHQLSHMSLIFLTRLMMLFQTRMGEGRKSFVLFLERQNGLARLYKIKLINLWSIHLSLK